MRQGFRLDINGLRAYAVLAVVLYHFGVAGFSGGFVGVDVFFVISGFLMYSIISRDLTEQRFSYKGFFLARARRIFPALAVLCVVLLVLGWFFLMPKEYQQLGRHVRESLLFSSNVRYFNEAGYFDVASQNKWLLHTWSLSVEWQFYLLLPLLMALLYKLRASRALLGAALLTCGALSLGYCLWLTPNNPSQAFYLLPTRAWEMLAGAMVAHWGTSLKASTARLVEVFGLGAIASAVVLFDHKTLWPSGFALLPVVGAMFVLIAARTDSLLTGNAAAQWLGTRSYSIYLWHWPVVVALAYVGRLENGLWVSAGVLGSIVLGALSYQWVEVPSQKWLGRVRPRTAFIALLCVFLGLAVAAQIVRRSGFAERLPEAIKAIDQARHNANPRLDECLDAASKCVYGQGPLQLVLVGDSHADAVVTAVADSVAGSVLFRGESGCPIAFGLKSPAKDQDCEDLNRSLEQEIQALPKEVPLLMIDHTSGHLAFAKLGAEANDFYFSKSTSLITQGFLDEFAEHYVDTLCRMAQTREVYVLRPIPNMPVDVPTALGRSLLLTGKIEPVSLSLTQYAKSHALTLKMQDQAAAQCGVKLLETTPYLCGAERCDAQQEGVVLYRDNNHLTEAGNKKLLPLFKEVFGQTPAAN